MKARVVAAIATAWIMGIGIARGQDMPAPQQAGPGWGQRDGRMGMPNLGGGILGSVTESASDHYTVKTDSGDLYTIHFGANTRIMLLPARAAGAEGPRTPPEAIKPSEIKPGDAIMAMGEVDAAAKSVGAMAVMKLDPERARQMRAMQANFGKTWLAGKVTAIEETKLTLAGSVDHASHSFVADENTSFMKHREPIVLADIQVGDNVRVEGALKDGVFVARSVVVMPIQAHGGPAPPVGNGPPK